jgi:hypothetical protein
MRLVLCRFGNIGTASNRIVSARVSKLAYQRRIVAKCKMRGVLRRLLQESFHSRFIFRASFRRFIYTQVRFLGP